MWELVNGVYYHIREAREGHKDNNIAYSLSVKSQFTHINFLNF